jgi:hypothetical protein
MRNRITGGALVLVAACAPAPAWAQQGPPSPPGTAGPVAPPEWTPPGDATGSGEGNLHGAPLFPPTGEMRRFTLTWNPFTLFAVRAQLSLQILLTDHHALTLSGFYGATRTNEVYSPSCVGKGSPHGCALTTLFQAEGGEIGYRWYAGTGGPRGLYVGPSFLLSHDTATPARGAGTSAAVFGAEIPYWNLGGAIDVGWQAILADRFVVGLGGGLQYTVPTVTLPAQELPASIYANRGLRPRVLLDLGVAFD